MELVFENKHFKWWNVSAPTDETITLLKDQYQLNPLSIADSIEPGHLPKFESDEEWQFMIIRCFHKEAAFYHNIVRQFSNKLSIFYNEKTIITIHQQAIPFLANIKEQIQASKTPEALTYKSILYKLFYATLQSYQAPADVMAEGIDRHEGNVFLGNRKKVELKILYQIKREASSCKKVLTITQDVLKEYALANKKSAQFRDIQELNLKMLHLHGQILEDAQNIMNLTIALSDQKANEVMKVLTIFSAFFLPLSFVAGIYGMNFDNMPELTAPYGYVFALLGMLGIVIAIFVWFRRKKIL